MALGAETSGRNPQKPFGLFVVPRTTLEERNSSVTSVILQTNKPMAAKHEHFWGR